MKENSKITPELLETVEQYYNGSISSEKRLLLEQQIENDPEFKILVEDIKTTLLGLESQALKEQLDIYHEDIKPNHKQLRSLSRSRPFNFVALGLAAVIIVSLGLFWLMRGDSNESLFNNYFTVDPGLPTTMSTTDNFVFYDAMVNYKQGEYHKAISKWEGLVPKSPENDTLNYFLGVAHLADKRSENAVPYLQKTIENTESVFLDDAYFYLGLAYIKSDKTEEAKAVFQKSNSGKSKEILAKLN